MDLKRAGLMFYGLQIASSVVARLEKAEPVETVRSVHNLAGDPLDFTEAAKFGMDMLAPVDEVCEIPQDCADRSENLSINAQSDESSSVNKKAPTIKNKRVPHPSSAWVGTKISTCRSQIGKTPENKLSPRPQPLTSCRNNEKNAIFHLIRIHKERVVP